MYFVLTKRPEYVLFCMSPSERFAVGVSEHRVVHLLVPDPGGAWQVLREWNAEEYSHTAFMAQLRNREEPDDPEQLLALLPPNLR